ncbi:MAG: putative isochorismatase family protein [Candidatus Bathyarchaeota archaeon BA1]|nr:MAG: putative isochorismatase family protein [Candidatus Bathyarchaeota archaeon BA1]
MEGRRGLDGFHGTNLDAILRYRHIKNVAIAGFLTNVCVESTARTAFDLNYRVIILKDCTAATTREEQTYAETKIFPLIGEVTTHQDFLKNLSENRSFISPFPASFSLACIEEFKKIRSLCIFSGYGLVARSMLCFDHNSAFGILETTWKGLMR